MATQVIETPGGITFSGFYYPEILRDLLLFLRQNRERLGLTDENAFEVHVQLLRAFACVGHLNNTRLDTIATETYPDTAQLLESVKRAFRLVGIELPSASPAAVDVVCKLSEVTSVDVTDFVPMLSEFGTETVPPITFEDLDGSDLDRTDRPGYVFAQEQIDSGADGSVLTDTADVFTRVAGSWPADVVGRHLFVSGSIYANAGEFRVVSRLSDKDIRVMRLPYNLSPGFLTETSLDWRLSKYTDFSVQAVTPGLSFTPWSVLHVGDCLFVGHRQMMTSRLDLDMSTPADGLTGVWEYFDDELSSFAPDSVTNLGSTLRFKCDALLGSGDRHGALITVHYIKTGAEETVLSTYVSSENRIETSGLLGQIAPSTLAEDYRITAQWVPFPNQNDVTEGLRSDDKVEWDLPQDEERSWLNSQVNQTEAFWLRFRIITAAGALPIIEDVFVDQGDQYIMRRATQGETVGPIVIGSSTGQVNQRFTLPNTPYLDETEYIEVDEAGLGTWIAYTYVRSFRNSTSTDRHYMREVSAEGQATVIFGDGSTGRIPPAGVNNIRSTHRTGGDVDGNVGPWTILSNQSGVSGISEVFNPRAANGWRIKAGGDDADLARVKRDTPASFRTRDRACSPEDCVFLVTHEFVADDGTKPVVRAWAVEEGFGPKTIKLICVGAGGRTLTADQLTEVNLYFNGDRYARPPLEGVLVANQRVVAINYEPSLVTVEIVASWIGGSAEQIRNAVMAALTPLATEEDGVTYKWDFGAQVSYSKVHSLIHAIDPQITNVDTLKLNGLPQSVILGANELPVTTAASIAVTVQE